MVSKVTLEVMVQRRQLLSKETFHSFPTGGSASLIVPVFPRS
jgi:hypothetical protein